MRTFLSMAGGVAAAMLVGAAQAGPMTISLTSGAGLEGLGSFTGSMQWNYAGQGATYGLLSVTLTNTSSVHGYLTAFALKGPSSGFTYAKDSAAAPAQNFGMIGGGANPAGTVSAAPWGSYTFGASTSSSWLGGGTPLKGLDVGQTGTVVFKVSALASLLGGLDATSFFSTAGGTPEFVVRFRGFDNGGSDKVVAMQQQQPPPTVVPVPLPAAMAATGLLGLGVLRRRRAAAAGR